MEKILNVSTLFIIIILFIVIYLALSYYLLSILASDRQIITILVSIWVVLIGIFITYQETAAMPEESDITLESSIIMITIGTGIIILAISIFTYKLEIARIIDIGEDVVSETEAKHWEF